jgi:molybdopterin/thiamine biosynthesis adenylyltransferase
MEKRIALIGVGTIGSHLASILGRMQVPMTLYDHDTVEEHNLTTQTYGAADIGKTKVEAVLAQLAHVQPEHPHDVVVGKFEPWGDDKAFDLIVSAVDSLEARKEIAKMLIEQGITLPIVDGRVGREQVEVYYFENAKAWLDQLPEEGDEDPCGARFTAYSAVIAAGLMANDIKRFLMNQTVQPRIIFDAASHTFIKQ